jgi:hypothetical protein
MRAKINKGNSVFIGKNHADWKRILLGVFTGGASELVRASVPDSSSKNSKESDESTEETPKKEVKYVEKEIPKETDSETSYTKYVVLGICAVALIVVLV